MPVVPFLPAIAGVAGAAIGANAQNKASKQAANASQQASDQAIAEQRRQYDLSRGDNAPWLQAGQGALAQLSQLYGLGGQGGQQAGQGFNWNSYLQANPDVQQAIAGGAFGGEGGLAGAAQRHYQEYGQTEGRAGPAVSTNLDPFFASPDYQFRQNEQMRALTARNASLGIQDSGAAQKSAMQYSGNLASGEFNNFANRLSAIAGVGQTAAGQNQALGQNFAGAVGQIGLGNAQNLASSYLQRGQTNSSLASNVAGFGGSLFNQFQNNRTPTWGGSSMPDSAFRW